jgi:predicted DNA-binding transcriptional regulator AlpA
MPDRLTARECASLAGVKASTWDAYVTRGYAPPADGRLGNQRWWLRSTVEQWMQSRPGQGARTDREIKKGDR